MWTGLGWLTQHLLKGVSAASGLQWLSVKRPRTSARRCPCKRTFPAPLGEHTPGAQSWITRADGARLHEKPTCRPPARPHRLALPASVRARVPAAPSPPLGLVLSLFRTSPLLTDAWGHLVVVLIRVSRRTEMQRVLPWARCRLFSTRFNARRVPAASRQSLGRRAASAAAPAVPELWPPCSSASDGASEQGALLPGERHQRSQTAARRRRPPAGSAGSTTGRDTVLTVRTRTAQEPDRVGARSPECDPALSGILASAEHPRP